MSSRDLILHKLGGSTHMPGYRPAADQFTEQTGADCLSRYIELANESLTTTVCVEAWQMVPAAIADYLYSNNLDPMVVLDSNAPLDEVDWKDSDIAFRPPPLRDDGDVLVSDCFGAVAENGALVISSNDGISIANDFLAETHIVLLPEGRIFPGLADLWQVLRSGRHMPREFCLVTGPSRTADLGVPAKMGAHGPARVHVIIIADAE